MDKLIGTVTHYFPKIGVAVVKLTDDINDGDQIRIAGIHSNFNQLVSSMQIEHKNITSAKKGQEIGMKVVQQVREGDMIYKVL